MPNMVWVFIENGERPVDLLQQDNPCKLMCQRHFAKGKDQTCRLPRLVAESISRPDGKQKRQTRAGLVFAQECSKCFGRKLLAPAIQQHQGVSRSAAAF